MSVMQISFRDFGSCRDQRGGRGRTAELLANKNFFGVEEFAETLNLKAELNELFHMLGSLNVDLNDLKRAKELAASYPRILAAIHNLEELHKVLEVYGIQKYISF